MKAFNPLTVALQQYFTRPFEDIPEHLKSRVKRAFSQIPWDSRSPAGRLNEVFARDLEADPVSSAAMQRIFELSYLIAEAKAESTKFEARLQEDAMTRWGVRSMAPLLIKHRASSQKDLVEFEKWANSWKSKVGTYPSRAQAYTEFAKPRKLSRSWSRLAIMGLSAEGRKRRGAPKKSTKRRK